MSKESELSIKVTSAVSISRQPLILKKLSTGFLVKKTNQGQIFQVVRICGRPLSWKS